MNALYGSPDDDSVSDEIGEEKLDTDRILNNFGVTLLFISAVLIVLISLIAVATIIIKRTGYEGRLKDRINSLRQRIFYNMLIEYSLVNSLKFYILAFLSLNKSDLGTKLLGAGVLAFFLVLPLFFARLLKKNEERLGLAEVRQKIGVLYEGLTTVNAINRSSKRQLTWLYSPLFLLRRCAFSALTAYMLDYPNL